MSERDELHEMRIRVLKAQERQLLADAEAAEFHSRIKRSQHDSRTYHFTGMVNEASVETATVVLDAWAAESDAPITLNINCPGGSVFSGFGLYDRLLEIAAAVPLETTAYGYAASMAAVLLQAGTVRTIRPNAWVMVHEASRISGGTLSELRDQVELLESLQKRTVLELCAKSTLTPELIAEKADRKDWWLDAGQALDAGLVDKIVMPTGGVREREGS